MKDKKLILLFIISFYGLVFAKNEIDSVRVTFMSPYLEFFVSNTCIFDKGYNYVYAIDSAQETSMKTYLIKDSIQLFNLNRLFKNAKLNFLRGQCDTRVHLRIYVKGKEWKCMCLNGVAGCIEYEGITLNDDGSIFKYLCKICKVSTEGY